MQLPTEMYQNYIVRRDEDYKELVIALEKSDVSIFKKIGHQIKGNASSFGFDDLTLIGIRMHKLEAEDLQLEGSNILSELKTWIELKRKSYHI